MCCVSTVMLTWVLGKTLKGGTRIMSETGNCYGCEFYKEDTCKRMEKSFATMVNPVCLQKITVILLRDLLFLVADYVEEE